MDTNRRLVRTKYGDKCVFHGWFQWSGKGLAASRMIAKPVAVLEFEDGSCALADVGGFKFLSPQERNEVAK